MTVDADLNGVLNGKDFAEIFNLLQDGEKTATDLEKKLDSVEEVLNSLLAQMEHKDEAPFSEESSSNKDAEPKLEQNRNNN